MTNSQGQMICFTFTNDDRVYIGYQQEHSILKVSFRVVIDRNGRPTWEHYLKEVCHDYQITTPDFTRMESHDKALYKKLHGIC
jgi:hypothetical protein